MIFKPTCIPGAYIIEPERLLDDRGFFARTWSREALEEKGLNPAVAECSISYNRRAGTLRGMHYQAPPHEEAKVVRCTMGAIYDVIVDLRASSPSFRKWISVELNQDNRLLLYVPEGVAHGFQTLTEGSEVYYEISTQHAPESARGIRWNDPAIAVTWPLPVSVMSERDASLPICEQFSG